MEAILQQYYQKPELNSDDFGFSFQLHDGTVNIDESYKDNDQDTNEKYAQMVENIKRKHPNRVKVNTIQTKAKIKVKVQKKPTYEILFDQMRPTNIVITIQIPEDQKVTMKQNKLTRKDYESSKLDYIEQHINRKNETKNYIKASSYYLANRKAFVNFINSNLLPYKNLQKKSNTLSCKTLNDKKEFSLMPHQNIVREYISIYSPYRGLLLYHGLGSGKTCSSIAIAEGLKSDKKVVVLTPASLKTNYLEELKSCGDFLYKKQLHWKQVSITDEEYMRKFADIGDFASKNNKVWLMDETKESNYEKLNTKEQKSLNKQLDDMIRKKYEFISYNGLRQDHMKKLTRNFSINPFDNKVVIVDEAHNLVSRIVNKLGEKETSISLQLYDYLLSAENVKIVFLSGTPIINYPHESAVMFNILRGYITTFNVKLKTQRTGKIDTKYFDVLLQSIPTTDYVRYIPSTSVLTVTKNPFGFINSNNSKKERNEDGNMTNKEYELQLKNILQKNKFQFENNDFQVVQNVALPHDKDSFNAMFLEEKQKRIKFKNANMFKRRILGLVSYFRSSQEQLMPRYNADEDLHIIEVPMSDYQFEIYNVARKEERTIEKKKSNTETSSSYRVFSRSFCNFVFPNSIKRPLPTESDQLEDAIKIKVNENQLDNIVEEEEDNSDSKQNNESENELYEQKIKNAMRELEINKSEHLNKTQLKTYSPKFLHTLENLQNVDHIGLHLLYSHFRTLEGIGIFRLVLLQNGFAEFKLTRKSKWAIQQSENKPKFVLYTGTESTEEKELIRNIFNSNWDKIPYYLRDELKQIAPNNHNGDIIRIFMISSSGAEGISLRNVNYVHIMEPYWHPVRTDQVIGRARRICSHEDLPEDKKFVKVFMYLMTFTDKQKDPKNKYSRDLYKYDKSKLEKKITPYTTDQYLYEISKIKRDTSELILTSIKEASIDCVVNTKDKKLKCFSIGATNPNEYVSTPSYDEQERDNMLQQNVKLNKWKGKRIKIDDVIYIQKYTMDEEPTNELYDYESYKDARKSTKATAILVGYLSTDENGKQIITTEFA